MNNTRTRESLLVTFLTDENQRTMSLPNPEQGIDAAQVISGANMIIMARPFDEMSGELKALKGAEVRRVTTTKLL